MEGGGGGGCPLVCHIHLMIPFPPISSLPQWLAGLAIVPVVAGSRQTEVGGCLWSDRGTPQVRLPLSDGAVCGGYDVACTRKRTFTI